MRPLRVLYLHVTGAFGGSSRSLFEVIRAFPPGAVEASFVTQRGTVREFFARLGTVIEARGLSKFDHTAYSYYRGMRWLVLLREIAFLPSTVLALRRARRLLRQVDVIHLNEITGLVTLWLARRWFDVPAVVHVRAVARDDSRSWRTRWVTSMLRQQARAVVAIDETVRASLPADLPVDVIHNAFSPDSAATVEDAFEARFAALRPKSFKVGFVGNLLRAKGVHELIEAARLTRDAGIDVEFLLVGDDARSSRGLKARALKTLGLAQDMRADVEMALQRHGLRERVHLMGFTADIARAYRCMDVLVFPSHFDAPGRPIFEAAFFGVPSIVAIRNPRPDTLIDGETGLAVEPHSARALAHAIERMANDRAVTRRMGEAARAMAEGNFNPQRNAARLLDVYRRVLSKGR